MSRESGVEVDVLVPTRNRPVELATTLAGLAGQQGVRFTVLVSDQSDAAPSWDTAPARALARVLREQGRPVRFARRLPRRGLADHRAALLAGARARYVLFLDDDVWLAAGALARLVTAIRALGCGFVGAAVHGLSHSDDVRPHETAGYEEWRTPPVPEVVAPGSAAWRRHLLHNAANPLHLARRAGLRSGLDGAGPDDWRAYKVAWVGGCVLYRRAALVACGGFTFDVDLPVEHCGEDVAVQQRVMARYGGAGVLPSGAVHLESPTTVVDRSVDLPRVLGRRGRPTTGGPDGDGGGPVGVGRTWQSRLQVDG